MLNQMFWKIVQPNLIQAKRLNAIKIQISQQIKTIKAYNGQKNNFNQDK